MMARQKIGLVGLPLVMTVLMTGAIYANESRGEQVYIQNCMVCHSNDGSGEMPGVPELSRKDPWFMKPEQQLLSKLKQGIQTPGAPISMPPKGGNPDLSDEDLVAVMAYMRKQLLK